MRWPVLRFQTFMLHRVIFAFYKRVLVAVDDVDAAGVCVDIVVTVYRLLALLALLAPLETPPIRRGPCAIH